MANSSKSFNKGGRNTSHLPSKGKGFASANQSASKPPTLKNSNNSAPRKTNWDTTCQICGKHGHAAIHCWHRLNHSIQLDNMAQVFLALNLNAKTNHEEWMSDTSAFFHITSHEGNWTNLFLYTSYDHVLINSREFLRITHVGDASIGSSDTQIVLHDVLLVPKLDRNLLSIGKLNFWLFNKLWIH